MSHVLIRTKLGNIKLALRADVAPQTANHFVQLVKSGVLALASFYRSDFVIQFGLHGAAKQSPLPNLKVNESKEKNALSNTRGAVAVAHWDVPDNGNSEFFISLRENKHLDTAYGGYAVFALVEGQDSFDTCDKIAAAIAKKEPAVLKIEGVDLM